MVELECLNFRIEPVNRVLLKYSYRVDVTYSDLPLFFQPKQESYSDFLINTKTGKPFEIPRAQSNYYNHVVPWVPNKTTFYRLEGKLTEKDVKNVAYKDVYLTNLSMDKLIKTNTNVDGEFYFRDIPSGIYNAISVDYDLTYNAVIYSGIKIE